MALNESKEQNKPGCDWDQINSYLWFLRCSHYTGPVILNCEGSRRGWHDFLRGYITLHGEGEGSISWFEEEHSVVEQS